MCHSISRCGRAGCAALAALTFFGALASGCGGEERATYKAEIEAGTDLEPGAEIRIEGDRVGEVVDSEPGTRFDVIEFEIEKSVQLEEAATLLVSLHEGFAQLKLRRGGRRLAEGSTIPITNTLIYDSSQRVSGIADCWREAGLEIATRPEQLGEVAADLEAARRDPFTQEIVDNGTEYVAARVEARRWRLLFVAPGSGDTPSVEEVLADPQAATVVGYARLDEPGAPHQASCVLRTDDSRAP